MVFQNCFEVGHPNDFITRSTLGFDTWDVKTIFNLCVCVCVVLVYVVSFGGCRVTYSGLLQGMKKHKLLREDILPAMASNRKVQRLLNEFMDLLSEYETTEVIPDPKSATPPIESLPTTDQTDATPPTNDQVAFALSAADQTGSVQPAGYKTEFAPTEVNQIGLAVPEKDGIESKAPPVKNVDLDRPSDPLDPAPQVKETDGS